MSRCAILITTAFPFAAGEPYLEAEIPVLAAAFDRVLIFTVGLHPHARQTLTLPQNVTAFNCAQRPPRQARLRDVLRGIPAALVLPRLPQADRREAGASVLRRAFLGYFTARTKRHTAEIAQQIQTMDFSGYDDVLLYGYWFFVAAAVAVELRPILQRRGAGSVRTISRAHGYDLYTYANRLGYLPCRTALLQALDAVYPCSEDGAAYLRERYPAFTEKIRPAFLGTNGGVLTAGSDDGVFRIVTCARTVPLKRLDRLALALAAWRPAFPAEWTHIGDGPELPKLRQIAQRFPDNVTARFCGAMPHEAVLTFYREHTADLFVLLSTREGLPVSVMEALSFGVPTAVTDVGGCTELIRDGENGFVLPADFSDAQLCRTLSLAAQKAGGMRSAAFETWRSRFVAQENYQRFVQTVTALFAS
ncbi:MAG: glycosyltransferase [Clostridia bacterium]|nr:glycosyltransferase [Clostridia bacterium]